MPTASGVRRTFCCAASVLACCLVAQSAAAGPAEEYLDAQLRVVAGLEGELDRLADAADAATERLLAGGQIWLAGEPGMISELVGRAGGLCGAKVLPSRAAALPLGKNDVVIFSDYGLPEPSPPDAWSRLLKSDALVIAFAAEENPILKGPLPENIRPIGLKMPYDSRIMPGPDGRRFMPVAAPAIATAEWAYVAELIGACRRQHRQLAVYLSIFLDPDRQRYKRTAGLLFEPDLRPEPVARKEYAGQFLAAVRSSLEAIRSEEIPNLRKAGAWLAEAAAAHAQIIRNFQGHLPPAEAGGPGDVDFFTNARPIRDTGPEGEAWVRANLHAGDVYLLLGYQQNEDAMAAAANALGARTIFFTSRGPGAQERENPRHLYVNPHWPYTDACLDLPGYDVKACPLSGICGLTCYYAICGEAAKRP